MKILILNGSPRPNGSTSAIVEAFAEGAEEAGHSVEIIKVGRKKLQDVWAVNTAIQKEMVSVSRRMTRKKSTKLLNMQKCLYWHLQSTTIHFRPSFRRHSTGLMR